MFGTWLIAYRNLIRNSRRNFATGAAIAIGYAAMLALGGYIYRIEKYLQTYTIYAGKTGHITLFAKNGMNNYTTNPKLYSLSDEQQKIIQKVVQELPNVQLHGGQLFGTGLIGNGCRSVPYIANGIDPKLERLLRENPQFKQWAQKQTLMSKGKSLSEYPESLGGIAIASGLARLLNKPMVFDEFPSNQKPILITDCNGPDVRKLIASDSNVQLASGSWAGTMAAKDAEVVAQFESGMTELANSGLIAPLAYLQSLYDTKNVTQYSLWLRNPNQLLETMKELSERLKSQELDLDIIPWTDQGVSPMYSGTMQFLYTLVSFLTAVLAVVVVFSIFNASTMTIIERSQEIGMMRSLGFKQSQIKSLFVQEAILLAIIAIISGGIIGFLGIGAVNAADIRINPPGMVGGTRLELVPNYLTFFTASVLIFSLAIFTTILAIRSVVRRKITDLLLGSQR